MLLKRSSLFRIDTLFSKEMAESSSSRKTRTRLSESTISFVGKFPSFDEVISGKVAYEPWLVTNFREFLFLELNEENLLFFEEVEAFKCMKNVPNAKTPLPSMLFLPKQARQNEFIYAKEIASVFVKEGSPHQVNISATQRDKLLLDIQNGTEKNSLDAHLFDEAQNEVHKIMIQDAWPRFVIQVVMFNISGEDSELRVKWGILYVIFTILIYGMFMGIPVPRWFILPLIYPIFMATIHFFTVQAKFCVDKALEGIREHGPSSPISCPVVKAEAKRRAFRIYVKVITFSILMTGFLFSTTYMVEAGIGNYNRYSF